MVCAPVVAATLEPMRARLLTDGCPTAYPVTPHATGYCRVVTAVASRSCASLQPSIQLRGSSVLHRCLPACGGWLPPHPSDADAVDRRGESPSPTRCSGGPPSPLAQHTTGRVRPVRPLVTACGGHRPGVRRAPHRIQSADCASHQPQAWRSHAERPRPYDTALLAITQP